MVYDSSFDTNQDTLFMQLPIESHSFFTIGKTNIPFSSTLTINLQRYVDSFAQRSPEYFKYQAALHEEIVGVNGQLIWVELLESALLHSTTDENIDIIKHSPACKIMAQSFIELVKNVMDEAILGNKPRLELCLQIDLSKYNMISLKIEDNGRGFPDMFIKMVQSRDTKEHYLSEKGSSKQDYAASSDDLIPKLFGGAGKGLRILIKQVLAMHDKRQDNDISFDNRKEKSGAVIVITTPLKPVQSCFFASASSASSTAGGLENSPPMSAMP